MLLNAIRHNFDELADLLRQLSDFEYTQPCVELGGSTIGEHIRHIVEMYQVLANAYASGSVDYDKRERNLLLQTNTGFALQAINTLMGDLEKPDKPLELVQTTGDGLFSIASNYRRELLYNLEHSIHHQALIKVAVRHCQATVGQNFGVAKSTIEHRNKCAQ